jgi:hypothetical protein
MKYRPWPMRSAPTRRRLLPSQDRHTAEETRALRADRRILTAAVFARDGSRFAYFSQWRAAVGATVRPILLDGKQIGTILIRCDLKDAIETPEAFR